AAAARRVVAVEVDRGLVAALGEVLAGVGNVEVVHADALRVGPARLLGGEQARAVANLPYRIATPLLFHLLACPAITDAFVMVQREVGDRWAAGAGDPQYGAVSVKLALVADVELVARVPRTVFHPVPRVDSVTVRVRRRADRLPEGELEAVVTVVEAAFAQRRKTLRNALAGLTGPDELAAAFARAGVDSTARAEQLDVAAFRRLGAALGVTADGRP
ncbi:MAG TPA: rRNA adenine dimethyltransferase family protein, partial [Nitriliruptorales bacterium]|nr:rRNA adenine dimethyltransferase family protein [Nitriliruptorales bacterium]